MASKLAQTLGPKRAFFIFKKSIKALARVLLLLDTIYVSWGVALAQKGKQNETV